MGAMLKKGSITRAGGAVRLRLPASVANDLGRLQKGIVELGERLGCRSCFSGADCFFQMEREWIINERLEIAADRQAWNYLPSDPIPVLPQDPVPVKTLQVGFAEEVGTDIESVQQAVARVVDRLGCSACCSGFDIFFRQQLDLITIDRELNVQGFGRFA